jgi:hypothetical protein
MSASDSISSSTTDSLSVADSSDSSGISIGAVSARNRCQCMAERNICILKYIGTTQQRVCVRDVKIEACRKFPGVVSIKKNQTYQHQLLVQELRFQFQFPVRIQLQLQLPESPRSMVLLFLQS